MRRPDRSLQVALLNPCFWPEVRRGGERLARSLADQLLARGHHPRLITSHPGWPTHSVEGGLEIIRHWRPPPEGWLLRRGFLEYMTHVPLSYTSLVRGEYDVAQALYVTDALAAARWSRRTSGPSILSYVGITTRSGLTDRRLRFEVTAAAVRRCTAVTVLSRAARDELWRWLAVEGRVIHPPVDLDEFSPGGKRAPSPVVFCPAALDEPRKRVEVLVAAMRAVRRIRPDARLLLDRRGAARTSGRLGSDGAAVDFLDLDAPGALLDAYRRAWVCALPSYGEAFGLVLAEALACGTPVVGADHGAVPEIIDGAPVGRTFELDDDESLSKAILEAFELATDPATAAACRGRAEHFSAVRCADRYEELYRELLS